MILAAHQPAYLPWLGYLDKIARSDAFVYLDSVQYEKNGFMNRNRVKTPAGPLWLTVPVRTRGHMTATLRTTRIAAGRDWRKKHLKTIRTCYRRAPHFAERFPRLEALYAEEHEFLADLCLRHLSFWLAELGIARPIVRARDLGAEGRKSDLILDICRRMGADRYLSGSGGRAYLREADFRREGIEVVYQDFVPQRYPQLYGPFAPRLGVLDLWMNVERPSEVAALREAASAVTA